MWSTIGYEWNYFTRRVMVGMVPRHGIFATDVDSRSFHFGFDFCMDLCIDLCIVSLAMMSSEL